MWIECSLLALQVIAGVTVGAESGPQGWPAGRWPRLVLRREEPLVFWVMLACQAALFLILWAFLRR